MQTVNTTAARTARNTHPNESAIRRGPRDAEQEPIKLLKRVGSTTFVVSVLFNAKSVETLEDKVLRLIKREVEQHG